MAVLLRAAGATTGPAVVRAQIQMPRVGAWVADLQLAGSTALGGTSGKAELVLGDVLVLKGTISRSAVFEGLLHARVVAGGDGLRKTIKPRHYTSPTVGIVLRDLLADAGEAASATIAAGLLTTQLEHWTTLAMPAAQALRCLVPKIGDDIAWRHLPDGTLWLGRETWPDSKVTDFVDVAASPEDDTIEVNMLTPELLAGTLLGGRKVDALEIRAIGSSTTATVWTVP